MKGAVLYTIELDTIPGLVDWGAFDPSAFAEELERNGALDPVVSASSDGVIGITAQFEALSISTAVTRAIVAGRFATHEVDYISAYVTPVLAETA